MRSRASWTTRRTSLGTAGAVALAVVAGALLAPGSAAGEERSGGSRTARPGGPDAAVQQCGGGSYQAEVWRDGGTWTAVNGDRTVYTGGNFRAAAQSAVDSLTPGRTQQESVVVWHAGSIGGGESIDLPSHTRFEACGAIDVSGTPTAGNAAVRVRGASDVSVPYLSVTGAPYFGVFVRNAADVSFGQLDVRLRSGLGVRIDNHDNRAVPTRNVSIDRVHVEGTSNHGVETYGVDGFTVGTVTARDVGYSGLLLNDTVNAQVGKVDAVNAGTGTGYAAFRMANRNGRVSNGYETNIRVGEVVARGGGRGIFCVSESGGAVIDRVDISGTGSNAILLENCYNVTIAGERGSVAGPGDIRIAARSEFPNSRDITLRNMTVTNSAVNESPCAVNTRVENLELVNSPQNLC
ncbi:right-handed parallel beta-helix repeat-containing protein [Streptomyces boncukensis]|uniref:Right-handed parallel beta-helix repeat-containing protein n=1 Tax=Streptomyces boncukensis TaxID=2711219 RepID=A0A6G4WXZ3_9ACTN|nr:right-handed parallel beta-helix repeat-containing protein [Streptomyces boncukensis]NGO69311.1 right-handed parallel beta-helix repeat-containing protein [Streptomyces boncukensis]